MIRILLALIMLTTCLPGVYAGDSASVPPGFQCTIREDGTISSLAYPNGMVPFFSEGRSTGPSLYIYDGSIVKRGAWTGNVYDGFMCNIDDVYASMKYDLSGDFLTFTVTLKNKGQQDFTPEKAGISLGIDTYMEEYPSWMEKYFPTLLMNEKTHFYGYLQSPEGRVLGIASKDPVASWSLDYNLSYYDIPEYWFYGHRIESVNLDLLNALPLPEHNPQDLWRLAPGQERSWTISLVPVESLDTYEEDMAEAVGIPMMKMNRTSFRAGETAVFDVLVKGDARPEVVVAHEEGKRVRTVLKRLSDDDGLTRWSVRQILPQTGAYDVKVSCDGFISTAVILASDTWENVLRNARQAALDNHQKPSSHVESWYGFHSAFTAAAHFPDADIDKELDARFDLIYDRIFDRKTGRPVIYEGRIQNTSSTIGMLVDRYEAYGRLADLEQAAALADWMIDYCQDPSGAYMNGNVKYTSVIYVAKSLMELYLVERNLGEDWEDRAQRHYDSVKKSIDELVASQGDFETEGEMTFEDGMISCSALQIGLFALLQEDECQRNHYKDAMLAILASHDCLTQHKVVDGRRRGGTMRFWEAQYDVLMVPNMINSPHGWSAWRAYASYYAYLLTLDERYLVETFNAAGAFSGLVDHKTGRLRWAFVVDPYLRVRQISAPVVGVSFDDVTTGNPHPDFYGSTESVIGEQYVDMISAWQPINSQDNDVHEVFKFIEEAVLTRAYVVERTDGTIAGYNCDVRRKGNRLIVIPYERQMTDVHLNVMHDYKVELKHR